MKKSTYEMMLTIRRGTPDLLIEIGSVTPGEGFVPTVRVKRPMLFEKHVLIHAISESLQKSPVFCREDGEELPVKVTLYDGWTGITMSFCHGTDAQKIKYSSNVLMPKYADKRLITMEQEKAIWKIGILRVNHLNKLRSGTWSKDKFLAEAEFLLSC